MNTKPSILLNGSTQLVGILGDPVQQVKAPMPLTLAMQALGLNAINIPIHVKSGALAPFLEATKPISSFIGHVLTVPHKFDGFELVHHASENARAAGSVNLVRRESDGSWLGDNTDGWGLIQALENAGVRTAGKKVLLVGAGGAGCGAAGALAASGVESIAIFDHSQQRSLALRERIIEHFPEIEITCPQKLSDTRAQIAINATPLGMHTNDPVPFSPALLGPGCTIADFVMSANETKLAIQARSRGLGYVNGQAILDGQTMKMAAFFAKSGPMHKQPHDRNTKGEP